MEVNTLTTPDRITIQVRSCGLGRAGIDRSSWIDLNTGRHKKAPVCCTPWCSTDIVTVVAQTSYIVSASYFDRKPMK